MSKPCLKVAVSVCSFTFADGRRCRTPHCADHPHLCYFHAKKEAQAAVTDQIGRDIATWFTGELFTACDLTGALGEVFSFAAQGKIKPKQVATFAYLGQTLLQTIKAAQHEYINAHGADTWRRVIRRGTCTPPPLPQSPQPARPSPRRPQPPKVAAQPDPLVDSSAGATQSPAHSQGSSDPQAGSTTLKPQVP